MDSLTFYYKYMSNICFLISFLKMKTELFIVLFIITLFSIIVLVFGSVSGLHESFRTIDHRKNGRDYTTTNLKNTQGNFVRKVAHYFPTTIRKEDKNNNKDLDTVDYPTNEGAYVSRDSDYDNSEGQEHGVIAGKIAGGIIGIIAIAIVVGVILIPLLLVLLLMPLGLVGLIGFSFPLVKLIEIPNPNDVGGGMRSILESGSCIERISCKIGKRSRSGTFMKIIMHWISKQFLGSNKLLVRISRGFEEENDCTTYKCSLPIF